MVSDDGGEGGRGDDGMEWAGGYKHSKMAACVDRRLNMWRAEESQRQTRVEKEGKARHTTSKRQYVRRSNMASMEGTTYDPTVPPRRSVHSTRMHFSPDEATSSRTRLTRARLLASVPT